MIRAAYMTHEFSDPKYMLLKSGPIGSNVKPSHARITQTPPRRTNQAPGHSATQLLKSTRNHCSPKSYSATQLLKLSGMHAAAYT